MLTASRAALITVAFSLLCACGGGGGGGVTPSTSGGGTIPSPPTTASVTVNIVGPSGTQSASVSVNGGTATTVACAGTCSPVVTAPIGTDTFLVTVFSGPNGTGTVLGQGSTSGNVSATSSNSVSVSFNAIVSVSITNAAGAVFGSVTVGSAAQIPLVITAKDGSGNTIVGTYNTPIHLLNLDTTGATTLNTTTVASSSTSVTLSYTGSTSFSGTRVRTSLNANPSINPLSSFLLLGPCSLPAGIGRSGYYPCDLQSGYNLTASSAANGGNQTVAVVDAYDDPSAESDLQIYRTAFGLPACTTANGCFKKISQTGSTTTLPPTDPSACSSTQGCWEDEEALDIDMVSAICPNCKILLVEANSSSLSNLEVAENTAVAQGATEITNSWGGPEDPSVIAQEAAFFHHPGVPITASTGDNGFSGGVSFPASSQYVTAVGGTTLLATANSRGWSESAWSGSGSGCSGFIPKPAWQLPPVGPIPLADCAFRMVSDVAADADTATAVWIYSTYQESNWLRFGGTSASAPMIAGVYAISGNASTINDGSFAYSHTSSLFDVTSGSTGTCTPLYFCNAQVGYDGPTGLGTPKGVSAFLRPESLPIDAPPERTSLNYHPGPFKRVCGEAPRPGYARCFALERTD